MRNNQQEANKLLLESWLNDVLDTGPRNGVERSARGKSGINPSCSGLSSYGRSRVPARGFPVWRHLIGRELVLFLPWR